MMISEKRWVWRFNRGSREALQEIYRMHRDELLTLATALLNDKTAAEDVIHDVFVGFLESAERFRLTGSLKGYLCRCTANRARNVNRFGRVRRAVSAAAMGETACGAEAPLAAVCGDEEQRRLHDALAMLPYEQREAVVLHIFSGLTFRQIGQIVGVSSNTVQGRYRYGLTRLRSLLNGEMQR